ncbi:hypothetical protein FRB96_007132 [Tulasnella sp. 330]|nr:hypothetical protein FRB96_007132 [Tulasnella sp. 330]KAG8876435.1 hypothetical protein FRB97_004172 [Tulasnella sp. 331]KAG8881883.1 hypothetical protein FRB98_004076 [Tulasnella sp. 332]
MLVRKGLRRVPNIARSYHDRSFGYRESRTLQIPDYTASELANRAENAALLRYVDSVRQHGHRAARIDPLDMLERDDVAALDPARYGLEDSEKMYIVDGILWNKQMPEGPRGSKQQGAWKLRDIVTFLREVYVGRIAYEFMHSPSKSERLWFTHLLESEVTRNAVNVEEKKKAWSLMARSETFDHFLQAKFPNLKRYGKEFQFLRLIL